MLIFFFIFIPAVLLAVANDIFIFFAAMELSTLCTYYVLANSAFDKAAGRGRFPRSAHVRRALLYLFVSAFCTVFFTTALALIIIGTYVYMGFYPGGVLFLLAVGLKQGFFPFHS